MDRLDHQRRETARAPVRSPSVPACANLSVYTTIKRQKTLPRNSVHDLRALSQHNLFGLGKVVSVSHSSIEALPHETRRCVETSIGLAVSWGLEAGT